MATSLAQQPQAIIAQTFHYPYHRSTYSQGAYTPPSSATPPSANSSPTNVIRQIYQPRQCGYVPAALRPTEMMANKNKRPLSPPRSAHSSLDSQLSKTSTLMTGTRSLPVTPVDDVGAFMAPFGAVSRVVTDEWNEELGEVTGAPTKNHWKPDCTASCCTSPTCTTVFSFMARRHHCRRCGGIYCNSHSAYSVPLDQEARFHPSGIPGRACDNCWTDYKIWNRDRKSRTNSIASGEIGHPTPPTNLPNQDLFAMGIKGDGKKEVHPLIAGQESIREGDWNWSTF